MPLPQRQREESEVPLEETLRLLGGKCEEALQRVQVCEREIEVLRQKVHRL